MCPEVLVVVEVVEVVEVVGGLTGGCIISGVSTTVGVELPHGGRPCEAGPILILEDEVIGIESWGSTEVVLGGSLGGCSIIGVVLGIGERRIREVLANGLASASGLEVRYMRLEYGVRVKDGPEDGPP